MLFFKEDDNDFEPIYVTTQYNRYWKIDYEAEALKEAEGGEEYVKPPFAYYEIVQKNFILTNTFYKGGSFYGNNCKKNQYCC